MVFCLVGRKKYSDAKDGYFTQDLCWTGLQLYSLERNLSQVRFKFMNLFGQKNSHFPNINLQHLRNW